MARYLGQFARSGLLNIAGGCCGNTPEHIAAIARALADAPPRGCPRARPRWRRRARPRRRRPGRGAELPPAAPVGLAAVHAAAGRVPDDRRAHQRRGLAQVRQADQGREIRGGGQRGAPAGGERRQRHRHLHGRRDDRRRRGDVALPVAAGQRARGGQGPVHGRLVEVGGDRGRHQVPAGEGDRQFDLPEGGRGQVPPERAHGAQVRGRRGGDGVRRGGAGGHLRGQDPHLRARLPHPGRRGRLRARGHHLRPQHPDRRHRDGGAQQLRGRLHQRHALDQGEPAARQGERRRVEHLVQLPRQQPRPRGDALGVPVPRDPGRHGHGHRQRRHAGGVRGDRPRAEAAGGGRAAQPAPRRHRAAGRLRRAAQGRRRRRRRGRQAAEGRGVAQAAPSRRACRTRWSRASTRTSTPTPRRRARSWAGRCW